jgi:V8-like Glu-specific endopeptidase
MSTATGHRGFTPSDWEAPSRIGVVLPDDNRIQVPNSTIPPYRWVGQLVSTWSEGPPTVGTATLVGTGHIVTCAHNLYDTKLRENATGAVFRPARNRNGDGIVVTPYGDFVVSTWLVPGQYVNEGGPRPGPRGVGRADVGSYAFDYAVGRISRLPLPPSPGMSEFQVAWPGDRTVQETAAQITGYSGDLDPTGCTQFTRTGSVQVVENSTFLTYRMSTYHGDSGSAISERLPGQNHWTIAGVHVSGVPDSYPGAKDGYNFGPAFQGKVLDEVREWLKLL